MICNEMLTWSLWYLMGFQGDRKVGLDCCVNFLQVFGFSLWYDRKLQCLSAEEIYMYINGLVQDCSISSAPALFLPQFCDKIYAIGQWFEHELAIASWTMSSLHSFINRRIYLYMASCIHFFCLWTFETASFFLIICALVSPIYHHYSCVILSWELSTKLSYVHCWT